MKCIFTTWQQLLCGTQTWVVCVLMVLGCLSSAQTYAAAAQPDVRILVDVSAGMHERDTAKLREVAMCTLVQQLPEKAMAGVWGYAQLTQRFANHAQSSALWKPVAVVHAKNPLRVTLKATENDISAWVAFSHAAVNDGSI
ncbi:MAG: hypothetical protein ACI9ON_002218 [Limisphaerales bacterium]|jgi:hypothetical protein